MLVLCKLDLYLVHLNFATGGLPKFAKLYILANLLKLITVQVTHLPMTLLIFTTI